MGDAKASPKFFVASFKFWIERRAHDRKVLFVATGG
jgi:hypothetical protein